MVDVPVDRLADIEREGLVTLDVGYGIGLISFM